VVLFDSYENLFRTIYNVFHSESRLHLCFAERMGYLELLGKVYGSSLTEVFFTYRFIDIQLLEEMRLPMPLVHVNCNTVHRILVVAKQSHKLNFKMQH